MFTVHLCGGRTITVSPVVDAYEDRRTYVMELAGGRKVRIPLDRIEYVDEDWNASNALDPEEPEEPEPSVAVVDFRAA